MYLDMNSRSLPHIKRLVHNMYTAQTPKTSVAVAMIEREGEGLTKWVNGAERGLGSESQRERVQSASVGKLAPILNGSLRAEI